MSLIWSTEGYPPSLLSLSPSHMSVKTQGNGVQGQNTFKINIIIYHTGLHLRSLNTSCLSQSVPPPPPTGLDRCCSECLGVQI